MNDYARVAAVIRYLDEHQAAQPDLAELAVASGLSPAHFHRLFHRWAGVTPKDFLQCLTAEQAKHRLRQSTSVLETALATGLSGPGRLHDLLVTLEAASPGEYKTCGQGMRIDWGRVGSPFGDCSIGWNVRGICHLAFHEPDTEFAVPSELQENWPAAEFHRDDRGARQHTIRIFNFSAAPPAPLRVFVRGTEFQLRVWRALLRIPPGCLASYGRLAEKIAAPQAARAVGTACGANPVAYLIPCHRVIRETGVVQGYRWGNIRKRTLLAWEAVQ